MPIESADWWTAASGLRVRAGPRFGSTADRAAGTPGLAQAAALTALTLAAVEGPLRLALHASGLGSAIFVRDLLFVAVPLAWCLAGRRGTPLPAALGCFALLMLVHGSVSLLNLGTPVAALYGLKLWLPLLCGLLLPSALLAPGPASLRLFALLWLITVAGAAAEKFSPVPMPWIGVNVDIGGVDVFLGRDWNSGAVKRVAGLTRSSINLAVLLPLLSLVLTAQVRSVLLRLLISAVTLWVLVWSTQKGAILAYALATVAWSLCSRRLSLPLRLAVLMVALLMVLGPVLGVHLQLSREQGVFSLESLIERIELMWPAAWHWVAAFPPWMGVGLGGIGGAQRFYAPLSFNPADNLFVFLVANAGPLALVYVGWLVLRALAHPWQDCRADGLLLASLVFLLGYGVVISLVEDHVSVLWLGAVIGQLCQPRGQPADRPRHGRAPYHADRESPCR